MQTMNADLALKMAKIFGVTVEFLLTGENQNTINGNITEKNIEYKDNYIKTLEEKAKLYEENASLVKQLLEIERQERKIAQEKSEKL
ncbi:plasmid maintenance system antidote protein VapI [Siphonobacter sp. SORGH_AS 1065]|nr:plasmid maintenance system antidote protein VapI [Siphonobacter sp. SORGH_AS_1065]